MDCRRSFLSSHSKVKKFIVVAVFAVVALSSAHFASACGGWFGTPCDNASVKVTQNQKNLEQVVPAPKLDSSLERINIGKRLQLFSDENKISYIYLTSFGKVMAFYTVKGKVTSGSKRLTPQNVSVDDYGRIAQVDNDNLSSGGPSFNIEQPELDGTYGQSSPYIYFWTTNGVYVQWNGEYMLADQALKLTTQPELVRQVQ